jgi:hypothetical protein
MTRPHFTYRVRPRWWRCLFALLAAAAPLSRAPTAGAQLLIQDASLAATLTWSTLSPAGMPPPLEYAAAVYDSDNKTIVLFGGVETDGSFSNDTWVWDGSTWVEYPGSEIQAPPARRSAAMAFDPALHQLILFGGQSSDGQLLNDTWAWNGASWYEQSNQSPLQSPSPREGAAMAYDGSGDLVLFGGTGAGAPGSTPPGSSTTSLPVSPPGSSPSATTASSEGPLKALSDTWLWTGSGWVPGTDSPAGPPARSGAALAFDQTHQEAVLFGGESTPADSNSPQLLGDTWAWTGDSWRRVAAKSGPPRRDNSVLVEDDLTKGLVLFGGAGSHGALGDTWFWNGSSWSAAGRGQSGPGSRAGAAAAFDGATHRLIVFGGKGPDGTAVGDTLAFGPAPPNLGTTAPTTSSTAGSPPLSSSASPSHGANIQPGVQPGPSTSRAQAAGSRTAATTTTRPPRPKSEVHRGDLVTLQGGGFRPGASITITFHSSSTVVGRSRADQAGRFKATVEVPQTAPGGVHHFEADGLGPSGVMTEQVATVSVVGIPGISSVLQRVVLTATAFLIPIVTWFVLVGSRRWRRRGRRPALQ